MYGPPSPPLPFNHTRMQVCSTQAPSSLLHLDRLHERPRRRQTRDDSSAFFLVSNTASPYPVTGGEETEGEGKMRQLENEVGILFGQGKKKS